MIELTEEEIQRQLSASHVAGVKQFKGKPLANWTGGLRDLTLKVLRPDTDTPEFHDAAMLYVLTEAQCEEDKSRETRKRLMRETDDVEEFRTRMNLWLDDWTREDRDKARGICDEILKLSQISEVTTVGVEKKSETDASPETIPLSPSCSESLST